MNVCIYSLRESALKLEVKKRAEHRGANDALPRAHRAVVVLSGREVWCRTGHAAPNLPCTIRSTTTYLHRVVGLEGVAAVARRDEDLLDGSVTHAR